MDYDGRRNSGLFAGRNASSSSDYIERLVAEGNHNPTNTLPLTVMYKGTGYEVEFDYESKPELKFLYKLFQVIVLKELVKVRDGNHKVIENLIIY